RWPDDPIARLVSWSKSTIEDVRDACNSNHSPEGPQHRAEAQGCGARDRCARRRCGSQARGYHRNLCGSHKRGLRERRDVTGGSLALIRDAGRCRGATTEDAEVTEEHRFQFVFPLCSSMSSVVKELQSARAPAPTSLSRPDWHHSVHLLNDCLGIDL